MYSSFKLHGGKLLIYTGLSDQAFSAKELLAYYARKLGNANGGRRRDGQLRSPVPRAPGMTHCAWRQIARRTSIRFRRSLTGLSTAQAPVEMIATGKTFPGRSRPLCAYPTQSQISRNRGRSKTPPTSSAACPNSRKSDRLDCGDGPIAFRPSTARLATAAGRTGMKMMPKRKMSMKVFVRGSRLSASAVRRLDGHWPRIAASRATCTSPTISRPPTRPFPTACMCPPSMTARQPCPWWWSCTVLDGTEDDMFDHDGPEPGLQRNSPIERGYIILAPRTAIAAPMAAMATSIRWW